MTHTPITRPPLWYAIIPAAGHSRRMGTPKLLLPYAGTSVIGHLISALKRPEIHAIGVVCRNDDLLLQAEVRKHGGIPLIPPQDPREMRESVQFGLEQIEAQFHPSNEDGWILIPADHPLINPQTLSQLLEQWTSTTQIAVPVFHERRGHPTLLSWPIKHRIPDIPPDRGLNWLLREAGIPVTELPSEHPSVLQDLDTPEDYHRLLEFPPNHKLTP